MSQRTGLGPAGVCLVSASGLGQSMYWRSCDLSNELRLAEGAAAHRGALSFWVSRSDSSLRNFCRAWVWGNLSKMSLGFRQWQWVVDHSWVVPTREILYSTISTNETHSCERKSHDKTTAISPKVLRAWAVKLFITFNLGPEPQGSKPRRNNQKKKKSNLYRHVLNLKGHITENVPSAQEESIR